MKRFENPILVTRPYLPDLEEFKEGCAEIWKNQWLTNNGPMVQRFQKELAAYLGVSESNIALFVNGTLALELGYKAMGLEGGEVITTPFTFVATSHALRRVGARPVFADIDPETLCLDPAKVEPLIKPGVTKAIVPVHVYGNICDVEGFQRLCEKYGIPIIYDAAHAFGVTTGRRLKVEGRTADVNHHSPTFNLQPSTSLQQKLFELRNFAIHGELNCTDVGANAKMNELQALMGLCCLKKIDELLDYRQQIYNAYAEEFGQVEGGRLKVEQRNESIHCSTSNLQPPTVRLLPYSANKAYVPVLFDSHETRERVYTELKENCNIFSRRYFYPLLTDFAPYAYAKGSCPIAEDIASRVLTLPTYYGLPLEDVKSIAENVLEIV